MDQCDPLLLAGLRWHKGEQGSILLGGLILSGAVTDRHKLSLLRDLGNQHEVGLEEVKCHGSSTAHCHPSLGSHNYRHSVDLGGSVSRAGSWRCCRPSQSGHILLCSSDCQCECKRKIHRDLSVLLPVAGNW